MNSLNSVATNSVPPSVESEDSEEDPCSDDGTDSIGAAPDQQQHTSTTFLEIKHHPQSGNLEPEYIFFGLPSASLKDHTLQAQYHLKGKPWAPFHTQANFELQKQSYNQQCPQRPFRN